LLNKASDEPSVTPFADCATEPPARRGLHRKSDPDNGTLPFDSQFIGLHFLEVARSGHQMVRYLLALGSGAVLPIRDGALIEPEGGDNGLWRTAPSQQGDDPHDQFRLMTQAIEGRSLGLGEGLAALFAPVTLVAAAMNSDVAFARLPFGRTVYVRAECCLRVHSLIPVLSVGAEKERISVGLSLCQKSMLPRFNVELPLEGD
jgi:hypothetical protein